MLTSWGIRSEHSEYELAVCLTDVMSDGQPVFTVFVSGPHPGPFKACFPSFPLQLATLLEFKEVLDRWVEQPLHVWRDNPFEDSRDFSADKHRSFRLAFWPDASRILTAGETVIHITCAGSSLEIEFAFAVDPTDLITLANRPEAVLAQVSRGAAPDSDQTW